VSAILEEAIEEVRALPPEEQQRLQELAAVLGRVTITAILYSFLRQEGISVSVSDVNELLSLLEKGGLSEPRGEETTPTPRSHSVTLSGRIRGKYAHVRTSSDAFAQLKQEEIELEDRRR
jgi:hypothetical protein